MEVLGATSVIRDGSPGAILHGRVERMYRSALILTFGGAPTSCSATSSPWSGWGCRGHRGSDDWSFTEEQEQLAALTRQIRAKAGRGTPCAPSRPPRNASTTSSSCSWAKPGSSLRVGGRLYGLIEQCRVLVGFVEP